MRKHDDEIAKQELYKQKLQEHGYRLRYRYNQFTQPALFLKKNEYLAKYDLSGAAIMYAMGTIMTLFLIANFVPWFNHSPLSFLGMICCGVLIALNLFENDINSGSGFTRSVVFFKSLHLGHLLKKGKRLKKALKIADDKTSLPKVGDMYIWGCQIDGYYTNETASGDAKDFSQANKNFMNNLDPDVLLIVDVETQQQNLKPIQRDLQKRQIENLTDSNSSYVDALVKKYSSEVDRFSIYEATEERTSIIIQSPSRDHVLNARQHLKNNLIGTVIDTLKPMTDEQVIRASENYTGVSKARGL